MKISATLDLDVLALEQADEVTLLLELAAPSLQGHRTRPPATLVVSLDRSGSMAGDRLSGACAALTALVDRLDPRDNLGVVAFDHQVQVVVPAGPLQDKAHVKAAIAALTPGGATDLAAGYVRGVQEAQRVAGAAGATLLLVSDGHANRGVLDPERLAGVARHANQAGITTSTLGYGLAYDELLLSALARGGNGDEMFAEDPDSGAAKIEGAVQGLLDQAVQAASLLVRLSPHVAAVAVLNDLPVQQVPGGVMAEIGSLYTGETRKLVMRFRIPGIAALGLTEVATLELTHVSLPDLVQHTVSVPVSVNVVPGDEAAGRLPRPEVRAEALFQLSQVQKRQGARLLSEGRVPEAGRQLRSAADSLREQAAQLPPELGRELAQEAASLMDMVAEAEAGHVSRAAKSASFDATYKSRTRGRRGIGDVLFVRADGACPYRVEELRLTRLRRMAQEAGVALSVARRNGPEVAQALAAALPEEDALRTFLLDAAAHGGFRVLPEGR